MFEGTVTAFGLFRLASRGKDFHLEVVLRTLVAGVQRLWFLGRHRGSPISCTWCWPDGGSLLGPTWQRSRRWPWRAVLLGASAVKAVWVLLFFYYVRDEVTPVGGTGGEGSSISPGLTSCRHGLDPGGRVQGQHSLGMVGQSLKSGPKG